MAEGVLLGITEEVLKNLGSRALDEIAAAWRFKPRLKQLQNTIDTIKKVLLDAEERQLESHAIRGWLQRLQAAVYAADDMFDELATVASKKKAMDGNKMTKEVRVFFSCSNHIALAFMISHKIKSIREELDAIAKDGHEFAFVLRPSEERGLVRRQLGDQTCSFVVADEVMGRDEDKKAILDILLASSTEELVSVVPIVGMGGLGKTTLAQFIHNDEEVKNYFELRLWVCVSDDFGEKEIIRKILMSTTNAAPQQLELDQLQIRLREELQEKKYLLVLDDVWNEDRQKWLKLSALLNTGKEGSKILVTTRSKEVARIMDTVPPYDLEGLSEEKSWALFRKMAFEPGQEHNSPQLIEAGKEIANKCGNVPLAIITLGSLLYGKHESKWLSVKDSKSLAKISDNKNNIMSILKLSYSHLWSPLKNCFAYCSLFPKD